MSWDIVIVSMGALMGALGWLLSIRPVLKLIRRTSRTEAPKKRHSERLAELTTNSNEASREFDSILGELTQVAKSRKSAVAKLESDWPSLEIREKELKGRIEILQQVPVPVVEHFARLIELGEKRSARRDHALFAFGVVVTTLITIAMQSLTGR